MAPRTPAPAPRICRWPNNSGATDFDDTVEACGIPDPSFDAHVDPTIDPMPVCDKHAEKAKAAGYVITPAGEACPVPNLRRGADKATVLAALAIEGTGDEELDVMASCARLLEQLPPAQRRRAGAWVGDRYAR